MDSEYEELKYTLTPDVLNGMLSSTSNSTSVNWTYVAHPKVVDSYNTLSSGYVMTQDHIKTNWKVVYGPPDWLVAGIQFAKTHGFKIEKILCHPEFVTQLAASSHLMLDFSAFKFMGYPIQEDADIDGIQIILYE